ncbi:UNKNOWN [Stylonychia lemnae]|uniref:Uncharacterized protein n=1 Tax=Stylonychia lemnae TaxID=5949 RepID=A0A078AVK3_STYLE|nr:UNKNOWN [Stylonychia lemnae]|eukprot:CDW86395.1 UNKNOWN [Stylonychia lemnae]
MKYLALFLVALTAVSARGIIKQEMMDDAEFTTKVGYSLYNGFVRGLYREHSRVIIDEQCFGEWMRQNMTHLANILDRVFMMEFPIPYNEAIQGATEVVNLFYLNQKYCSAFKVWDDLKSSCPDNDFFNCFDMDLLLANGKKNMFGLVTKIENIVELLLRADVQTDEEIISLFDTLGEDYGAIISYLIGFEKRFDSGSHKHRQLQLANPLQSAHIPSIFKHKFF